MDGHLKNEELHHHYGHYVRIGPNVLSITDPRVLDAAFQKHPWRKAEWYDNSRPHDSMHTTRDRGMHDRRRRFWAPAFSDRALREYEQSVKHFNHKLVERIAQFHGGPVNASKWVNLYAFDVMGRLAFGKDYGTLEASTIYTAEADVFQECLTLASKLTSLPLCLIMACDT
jgi:cytochrome P450